MRHAAASVVLLWGLAGCGGSANLGCGSGADCPSGVCAAAQCQPPSCSDGVKNGNETDIDCGGPCPRCGDGKTCQAPGDCTHMTCLIGRCVAPTCSDKVKDGDETDIDCGGACPACGDGKMCKAPRDCTGMVCKNGVCAKPACNDLIKNGDETDVDCGGSCPACSDGKMCLAPGDCASGLCPNALCAPCQLACTLPPSDCYLAGTCYGGACVYGPKAKGAGCDDFDVCTTGDQCDGAGLCRGMVTGCGGGASDWHLCAQSPIQSPSAIHVALAPSGMPVLLLHGVLPQGQGGDGRFHVWAIRYLTQHRVSNPVRVDAEVTADHGPDDNSYLGFLGARLVTVYSDPAAARWWVRTSDDGGQTFAPPATPAPLAQVPALPDFAGVFVDAGTLYFFFMDAVPGTVKLISTSDGVKWSTVTDTTLPFDGRFVGHLGDRFRVVRSMAGTWLFIGDAYADGGHQTIAVRRAAKLTGPWGPSIGVFTGCDPMAGSEIFLRGNGELVAVVAKQAFALGDLRRHSVDDGVTWIDEVQEAPAGTGYTDAARPVGMWVPRFSLAGEHEIWSDDALAGRQHVRVTQPFAVPNIFNVFGTTCTPLVDHDQPDVALLSQQMPGVVMSAVQPIGNGGDGLRHPWYFRYIPQQPVDAVRLDEEVKASNAAAPAIESLPNGTVIAVYQDPGSTRWRFRLSSNLGENFAAPVTPAPLANIVARPGFDDLAVDGAVAYFFFVDDPTPTTGTIKYVSSMDGTLWSAVQSTNCSLLGVPVFDSTSFRMMRRPATGTWIATLRVPGEGQGTGVGDGVGVRRSTMGLGGPWSPRIFVNTSNNSGVWRMGTTAVTKDGHLYSEVNWGSIYQRKSIDDGLSFVPLFWGEVPGVQESPSVNGQASTASVYSPALDQHLAWTRNFNTGYLGVTVLFTGNQNVAQMPIPSAQ